MIKPRLSEGIAVVTGASSGIGEAAAMQLSAAGFHMVLIARRRDRLEKLQLKIRESGGPADIICSDLSQEGS
ncbi:MAG: SDR family NAD(P)-dependent oxidoreductase [Anaerolineales bacterium]